MISFRVVARRGERHDTVLIYAGSNPDQRALVGTLTMLRPEADAFGRWLTGSWEGAWMGAPLEAQRIEGAGIELGILEPGEAVPL